MLESTAIEQSPSSNAILTLASELLNTPRRMFWSARRPVILLLGVLLFTTAGARAQLLPVWQIGVDDDPFAAGYNATGEFSSENYINDPRPGKVTRRPGDPLYNAANNPTADDDFYCAGFYPIGFNGLTTNLPVAFNEPDSAWERALTADGPLYGDRTNRVHFFLTAAHHLEVAERTRVGRGPRRQQPAFDRAIDDLEHLETAAPRVAE